MAPTKVSKGDAATTLLSLARKGISTRSQNIIDQNADPTRRNKRKADASPLKNDKVKRSALGNLTNAVVNVTIDKKAEIIKKEANKKTVTGAKTLKNIQNFLIPQNDTLKAKPATKILTRAAARNAAPQTTTTTTVVTTVLKSKDFLEVQKPTTRRISNEFDRTDDSLYMSALEDVSETTTRFSGNFDTKQKTETKKKQQQKIDDETRYIEKPCPLISGLKVPIGVIDFDRENWNDPYQVSHYAMDIFQYLKDRENTFLISDYMERQINLSKWMRSLLVDWMVEVQESFELNHETLYLAVKVVDLFLGKITVSKERLQLLGAAALFIACKFDERTPPLIDDFLYICDGAYNQKELIKMEMAVLKTIQYDLGIPLSYRFLRRYARVSKMLMPILTLARYILEFSLMDYTTIFFSDSKMACAALFIARRMNNISGWDSTLEFFSGYETKDFAQIVTVLNAGLHRKPKEALNTVRNKYSHKIFYEVAKLPLMDLSTLFEDKTIINSVSEKKMNSSSSMGV